MAHLIDALRRLSLAQRFLLATLVIMLAGTLGISTWLGQQIETGVIRQNSEASALLLDASVAPLLQTYAQTGQVDTQHALELDQLARSPALTKWLDAFSARDINGRLLYASDASLIGLPAPAPADLAAVAAGQVLFSIDRPEKDADSALRKFSDRLVKVYSPLRDSRTSKVIGLIEFYQDLDTLQAEIDNARRSSWYVIGAFMAGMYGLLALFSKRTGDTIERQQRELQQQVVQLTHFLDQNRQLRERVQDAAAGVAGLHEKLLRRTGSELHDGPAQGLSLALLQVDTAIAQAENDAPRPSRLEVLAGIQSVLEGALVEMRGIAAGLVLPQLAALPPADVFARVVRAHETRTHTRAELELRDLPEDLPLPVKITAYRIVQEALNNSFKHAGGMGQRVSVQGSGQDLSIEVCDDGPGFDAAQALRSSDRLGLVGMRERVISLGGSFEIRSQPGHGTAVRVVLPIRQPGGNDE